MKKNIFFAAVALVALVNCTGDERIGGEAISPDSPQGGQGAIVFSTVSKGITRAGSTGADAAEVLNKNFVVFGTKTSSSTTQTVFDNYQTNYVTGSEHTTTSNSAGWEYVGYTNLPNGVQSNVGVTTYANNTTTNTNGIEQTIKYWDYSADHYDFFAYSLGKGVTSGGTTTYAKASALGWDNTSGKYTYTLSGTTAQLSECYISDLLKKTDMNATNTQVSLQFQQLVSKLRIGLYEIIPGYSVKDVKFYPSAAGPSGYEAYLYVTGETGESLLPPEGTFTVTFDAKGKPQVTLATSGGSGAVTNVSFGNAQSTASENKWSNWASKEYKEVETDALFLGRTSSACTISEAQSVLPNPNGSELNLKVDYTLVSRDGNGETIEVKGATATVPAKYAKWQPGYSYTYLFKISDNTNGTTGQGTTGQDILGLSPITLDAVVNTGADGKQETITTVANPSITTYQKGSDYATTNEYKAGTIYVVVSNGSEVQTLTTTGDVNAKLYTATIEAGAAQGITEASVANALAQGTESPTGIWTVTDANGKKLTVTEVGNGLTAITAIPADPPHGEAVTINGASFSATAGKSYVFEYTYTENSETKKAYKVIKVAAGS